MERGQLHESQYGQNVLQPLHFCRVCYRLLIYNEGCHLRLMASKCPYTTVTASTRAVFQNREAIVNQDGNFNIKRDFHFVLLIIDHHYTLFTILLHGSIPESTQIHHFQKISEVINFERLKGQKIITSKIFCIRKFKCPKFFKHYFST